MRPLCSYGGDAYSYMLDRKYAEDRFSLCQAYRIIEDDLKKILEFIEPSDKNKKAYSHRIYELFLRCSTEFETNCKRILFANGYVKNKLNIKDYYKINKATSLSKYQVKMSLWHPKEKILRPLGEWSNGHSLKWYQAYNCVKHDRYKNFALANLWNVVNATAGGFAILFSQFDVYTFGPYNDQEESTESEDDGFVYTENSLFSIKPCKWQKKEQYSFDWNQLKDRKQPFQQYPF